MPHIKKCPKWDRKRLHEKGSKQEANDVGVTGLGEGVCQGVPEGEEEGQRSDLRRVCGGDGLPAPLCRAAAAPFRPEGVGWQGCGGGSGYPLSGPASETDRRWRSATGFEGDLAAAGLSVWEPTGGRFGADTDRLGETWRAEAEWGGTGGTASDQCGDDRTTAGARETKAAAEATRGYQAGDVAAPSSGRADVCGLGRGAAGVCGLRSLLHAGRSRVAQPAVRAASPVRELLLALAEAAREGAPRQPGGQTLLARKDSLSTRSGVSGESRPAGSDN